MIDLQVGPVAMAGVGGVLLGLLFFATLWWTVRAIQSARHPALLVAGSFLLRSILTAAGIVFVSGGRPLPLMVAVAGFLLSRTIMIRTVGAPLSGDKPAIEPVSNPSGEALPRRGSP